MKKTKLQVLCLLLGMLVFQACTSDSTNTNNTKTASGTKTTSDPAPPAAEPSAPEVQIEPDYEAPEPIVAKDFLYTWVDKLNIREKPSLKGKVVATVDSNQAVEVMEDKTGERTTYVLRGAAYEDHWYKVKTKDGKEGWVFGGAVKHENEKKGNAPMSDEKFSFPYFGSFNLSGWKNKGTNKEYGDAESVFETTTYRKGNRILEVVKMTQGRDHMNNSYKLMNGKGKVLKEREFRVLMNLDDDGEINENVRDYTASPMKEYNRTQKLKVHLSKLNARPMMALGPWTSIRIEANAAEVAALYDGIQSGGTVKLKEMFYNLEEPIVISGKTDFTLDGNRASLVMQDPNANVIFVDGSSNITIKDIRAKHIDPEGPLGCTGNVIQLESCSDVTIEMSQLNGSGIIGIMAYSTNNLHVENCYIYDNSKYGILFDARTSLHIKSNTFDNNGPDGETHVAKAADDGLSSIETINGDVNEGKLKMTYNRYGDDDI